MPRKPIAVVLTLISIMVVVVHYLIGPRYIDWLRDLDFQTILDPFMAVAVALALIVHFLGKQALDAENTDGSITRKYLEANLAFYTTVFLALWVFGNWLGVPTNWTLMYPLFLVVMGVTSLRLWRESSSV